MTCQEHELHGLFRNLYIRLRNFTVLSDALRAFPRYPFHLISSNTGRDMINLGQVGVFHNLSGMRASWTFRNLYIHQRNFTTLLDALRAFQWYPLRLISPNTGKDMINLGQVGEFHDSSGTRASWTLQEFTYPPTRFYGLVRCTQSFPTAPFAFNKS